MSRTLFNWDELWLLSRQDLSAIICLLYAQTDCYNEISGKTMRQKLNLHHIAPSLFYTKLFTQHKHSLTCNYKTKDAQSYFNNNSFLFTAASAKYKVVYLKALSMRKISDSKNSIPLEYFSNVKYNPFLHIENNKIIFPLESLL